MADISSYQRAALSAIVFVIVGGASGGFSADLSPYLTEAAIQAGAAIVSDYVHNAVDMVPSGITSGVVTGAVAAGAKYAIQGNTLLLVNFLGSAVVDTLTDYAAPYVWGAEASPYEEQEAE